MVPDRSAGMALSRLAGTVAVIVALTSCDGALTGTGHDDQSAGRADLDASAPQAYRPAPPPARPTGDSASPWAGNGIGVFARGQAFANLPLRKGIRISIRFRAEHGGAVRGVRTLLRRDGGGRSGYSAGDGGAIRVDLHQDDGHGQPGRLLATGAVYEAPEKTLGWQGKGSHDELRFAGDAQPAIVRGQVYHWVFHQLSDAGWLSINTTRDNQHDYDADAPGSSGVGLVPVFNNDLAVLRGSDGLEVRPGYVPIFSTVYADGSQRGQNLGSTQRDSRKSIDGANRIRARLEPTEDRRVGYAYAGCYKTTPASDGAVTVEIKDHAGTVLATTTMPQTRIGYDPDHGAASNYTADNQDPLHEAPWIRAALPAPLTLRGGETYFVEFSAPAGTDVWCVSMQDLTKTYGHDDPRYAEVAGEFSADGGVTWQNALRSGKPARDAVYPILLHLD